MSIVNGDYIDRPKLKTSKCNEYGRIIPVSNSEYLCFIDTEDEYSIVLDSPEGIKGLRKSRRFHYVLNPFYEYMGKFRVISDYGDFYIDGYENGELQTLYKINLGNEALPANMLPKTRKEFQTVDNSSNYFKCILDACETKKWICVNLVGPNNEYYVAFLNKEDLADMAESLVRMTCLKRHVTTDDETVGGPVDVAVITKGDGFIWIKRKHYFTPELNHHYFEK